MRPLLDLGLKGPILALVAMAGIAAFVSWGSNPKRVTNPADLGLSAAHAVYRTYGPEYHKADADHHNLRPPLTPVDDG